MLLTTKQAAKAVGLSEYELRRGWKEGRYPALVIGKNDQRLRLRWNIELLQASIMEKMRVMTIGAAGGMPRYKCSLYEATPTAMEKGVSKWRKDGC